MLGLLASQTLTAAPTITGFNPSHGAPGTQVLLSGAGLSSASAVLFDTRLADFQVLTNGQLIAVVPPAALTGRLRVTNPTGTGVSGTDFVVAPRLTGFSPGRGAPGTVVTVEGANLNGMTHVQFDGVSAAFAVTASTQIRAVVPGEAASGPIRVAGAAGTAVTTQAFGVTGPEPIVDGFSPPLGAPGAEILVEGANFTNVTAVRFNGVAAAVFSAPAYTQIRAVVPAATTGRITVSTAAGSGTSTNDFVVTTLPVITGFVPALGKAGQTAVTIEGVNFTGLVAPAVWFHGQPVAAFGTPAPNQIRVTVPAGATTGPITVRNAAGYGQSASDFVVTSAPIVDRFEPPLGAPGATVRLYGENFTGISRVTFNGVEAGFLPPPAPTQMDAAVPAGAATGPIAVQNAAGTGTTTSNFLVVPPFPFITRFAPAGGPRGTEVLIYGVHFGAAPLVRFDGVLDSTAYVVAEGAEQKIVAHAPAGAGTGLVTVTGPGGTSTNAAVYCYPPWLFGFAPTNGHVGDPVVLAGTNFTGATQVWFNDAPAPFTAEAGAITAFVPERARSGPVTVATPGGWIASTNAFRALPRLTNVTPGWGATGALVRIGGTSLDNVTSVTFNGVEAPFTNISFTEVHAVVPGAAATGPLRVATPDGSATASTFFLVVGPGDLVLGNTASAERIAPQQEVFFTLSLINRGPWTVTAVSLSGPLPPGFAPAGVETDTGCCVVTNGWLECRWDHLTNRAQAGVLVRGSFATEGYATFAPELAAAEGDPDGSNNRAAATVAVVTDRGRTLRITRVADGAAVCLAWPTSALPFRLESATGLAATNVWSAVPNAPAPFAEDNVVTNAVIGPWRLYRLHAVP
ncbi:MAG: IPT/TIG domain-containing protein [Verrucomicrobia bacterium]|nr:IPT/TIG domain-containing protein [Verrucomicrobiota bacterium]